MIVKLRNTKTIEAEDSKNRRKREHKRERKRERGWESDGKCEKCRDERSKREWK